jgi:chromosome segregation ATPase
MSKLIVSLLASAGIALAGAVGAAPIAKDAYNAEKERIEATYKKDREACSSLKDNAKDVCVEQAKAKEKIAKADNEAAFKDTEAARIEARIARAEANYAVAKEKCDDLKGNDKDVCVKEAKAAETKAKANAKVAKAAADPDRTATAKQAVRQDAAEDNREADYKVAIEKCDALTGTAKDNCVRDAKARFGKT